MASQSKIFTVWFCAVAIPDPNDTEADTIASTYYVGTTDSHDRLSVVDREHCSATCARHAADILNSGKPLEEELLRVPDDERANFTEVPDSLMKEAQRAERAISSHALIVLGHSPLLH